MIRWQSCLFVWICFFGLTFSNKNTFSAASRKFPQTLNDLDIDWDVYSNFLAPIDGDNINETCKADSQKYIDILNSPTALPSGNGWAYKMFDASVKIPPSSLIQGNVKKIGAFESCKEVKAETFKGKHCMVSLIPPGYSFADDEGKEKNGDEPAPAPPSRGFLLYTAAAVGRCIPDSCSEQDLQNSLSYFFAKVTETPIPVFATSCHSEDEEIPMTSADWTFVSVLVIFGLLIFTGTMIDISIKYFEAGFFNRRLVQVFQGFSFYRNTLKIFSTDVRKDTLTSINGIRFLSMTWVLFGHSYQQFQGLIPVSNNLAFYDKNGPIYDNIAFQALLEAFPAVDTFFMIGAVLLTYTTLKQLDKLKGGNIKFWIMFYVHRYLRLTAVYAMVIFFYATLFKHLATGPQSVYVTTEVEICQKSWWTNLLYINNFQLLFDNPDINGYLCLGQSWYLANDMQFFIISPIFIVALWYNKLIGMVLCGLGVAVATVIPTMLSYVNNYPISVGYIGTDLDYFTKFYVVPWCRFQPYIVGIIFGYILHKMRDQPKLKINPYFSIWIWAAAGVVGSLVIYGLYPYTDDYLDNILNPEYHVASKFASAAYNGFHRLAWSICIGWVVLSCAKGAAGPINSILSWPFWIPLANLSYCIYLVHLGVLTYVTSLFTFTVTFTHILGVYWILAILCFSIFVAFLFAVVFELPMAHLERIFFASLGIGSFPDVQKD